MMKTKNFPKANIENKRNLFLQISIVLALAVVLLSFQYVSPAEKTVSMVEVEHPTIEQEIIDFIIVKKDETIDDSVPLDTAEVMPEFPGGEEAMQLFLAKNVKYPRDAIERGVSGRVNVSFVVNVDGSISDVKVLQKVYPSLDRAAIAVVKKMPKWSPGMQGGKAVRVLKSAPLIFQLSPY